MLMLFITFFQRLHPEQTIPNKKISSIQFFNSFHIVYREFIRYSLHIDSQGNHREKHFGRVRITDENSFLSQFHLKL